MLTEIVILHCYCQVLMSVHAFDMVMADLTEAVDDSSQLMRAVLATAAACVVARTVWCSVGPPNRGVVKCAPAE